jgi:hypothetical protein
VGVTQGQVFYSVNAATQTYNFSGTVVLIAGETFWITADQGTGASVNCSPVNTNDCFFSIEET